MPAPWSVQWLADFAKLKLASNRIAFNLPVFDSRTGAALHTTTEERLIRPAHNIAGSLRLPGDKSISHRYGMLAAFAEGTSRFANFSTGADCASTLRCMQALGAKVQTLDDGTIEVTGVGGLVTPANHPLDC